MPTTDPTTAPFARLKAAPLAARIALALLPLTIVTATISMITDWRGRFAPPDDQGSVLSELAFSGSAIAIPIPPLLIYVAAALLAMRHDRWRTVCLVLIALGGVVTIIGGLGELIATPSIHTPQAVLLFAGIFYIPLGMIMVIAAIRDLVRGRPSR